jgi:DNA-binding NarL/FixJ family response regulator
MGDACMTTCILLTTREVEVLQLVEQGCSNAIIAARLCLSVYTVEVHLKNIYRKLAAVNRTQAVYLFRHANQTNAGNQVDGTPFA